MLPVNPLLVSWGAWPSEAKPIAIFPLCNTARFFIHPSGGPATFFSIPTGRYCCGFSSIIFHFRRIERDFRYRNLCAWLRRGQVLLLWFRGDVPLPGSFWCRAGPWFRNRFVGESGDRSYPVGSRGNVQVRVWGQSARNYESKTIIILST